MTTTNLRAKLKRGEFDDKLSALYLDKDAAKKRYITLCGKFIDYFGNLETSFFSAPGRTEIGGNHTDHQHGLVLAAAVDTDIIACVSFTDDNTITLKSHGYPQDVIDLSDLDINEDEKGKSSAMIRGICRAFKDNRYNIGGFKAYTCSDVPKGSGLSSSAAFEVLVSTVLNIGYNNAKVSPKEIAAFSQYAESVYFGKPCGLLDQTACAYGGVIFVDFADPKNPVCESIDIDFNAQGYKLFAVNTGGNHSGLTADYAAITDDCALASKALGVKYLGEADKDSFFNNIPTLMQNCSDRAVLRAMHIVLENERVKEQKKMLLDGDFKGFLKKVSESGDSSAKLLQNLYSISCPQEQGIPLGIALAQSVIGNDGAARVHGGGFAGTVQCYVPDAQVQEFVKLMESAFKENCCTKLNIRLYGGVQIK